MSKECPAGCCPHDGIGTDAGCPDDLPGAPLPERAAHLYACRMLSTYKIAAVTGTDRQRITRMLRKAGITVKPYGAGRRRAAEDERLDQLMARLYRDERMPSPQIARLTGVSERTVRDRLRARGVPLRTRGRHNREDRTAISPGDLTTLYVQDGLSAAEIGKMLGVSRKIVLRSAHDQGLPVRVGGPPPASGPSEIELLRRLLRRHRSQPRPGAARRPRGHPGRADLGTLRHTAPADCRTYHRPVRRLWTQHAPHRTAHRPACGNRRRSPARQRHPDAPRRRPFAVHAPLARNPHGPAYLPTFYS